MFVGRALCKKKHARTPIGIAGGGRRSSRKHGLPTTHLFFSKRARLTKELKKVRVADRRADVFSPRVTQAGTRCGRMASSGSVWAHVCCFDIGLVSVGIDISCRCMRSRAKKCGSFFILVSCLYISRRNSTTPDRRALFADAAQFLPAEDRAQLAPLPRPHRRSRRIPPPKKRRPRGCCPCWATPLRDRRCSLPHQDLETLRSRRRRGRGATATSP